MKQITEDTLEKLPVSKEMNSRIEWATKKDRADRPKKVTDLSVAQTPPNLDEGTIIDSPEEQADKTLIDYPKEQNEKLQSVLIKGKKYKTVRIGIQVWMAEKLNYAVDGSYCYDNDSSNCAKYGRIYTWEVAMQAASEIPSWHLPSDKEWDELAEALGGKRSWIFRDYPGIGNKLKSTLDWNDDRGISTNGTNSIGFNAFPGDSRNHKYGVSINRGDYAYFWSATPDGSSLAWKRVLSYYDSNLNRYNHSRKDTYAVRLVKD